jgi:hypothetical protein
MIKKLLPAIAFYFLAIFPAYAEWDSAGVQALPYLYHEQELKADVNALDAELKKLYLQRLRDYYLAEVNRQPYITQTFPEPLVYDDLSSQYVTVFQDIQNDFLRRVDADKDGLLSRLERDERQAFRNQLSSAEMVQLKNFYLAMPVFFELPLSFYNYQRFAKDVEMQPKTDLPQRMALAQQLAELLRLQETHYVIEGDEVHLILPAIVGKNLTASLTNNFSPEQLSAMLEQAQSEAGQSYLHMKERAFRDRFLMLENIYRTAIAKTVDALPSIARALPQLSYPSIIRLRNRGSAPYQRREGTTYCQNVKLNCDTLVENQTELLQATNTCIREHFNIETDMLKKFTPGPNPSEGWAQPVDTNGLPVWAICHAWKNSTGACIVQCSRYLNHKG